MKIFIGFSPSPLERGWGEVKIMGRGWGRG